MSHPPAPANDSESGIAATRYQFLRDRINLAQLQYLRANCESQGELDDAIDSLQNTDAQSRQRLNGNGAA